MVHPLTSSITEGAAWKIWGLAVLSVIGLVAVSNMDKFMKISTVISSGYSDVEYAGDVASLNAIFGVWDCTARVAAAFSAGLHYFNLICYVGLDVYANAWTAWKIRPVFPRLALVSDILAWAILPAAVLYGLVQFFIVYQVFIFTGLYPFPQLTRVFSPIFIAVLVAGIAWVLFVLLLRLIRHCRGVRDVHETTTNASLIQPLHDKL